MHTYWPMLTFDTIMATGSQNHSTPSNIVVANNTRRFPRLVHFSANVFCFTYNAVATLLKALPSLAYFKVQHINGLYCDRLPMDLPFLYRYASEYCPQLELIQIIEATSISTAAK